MKFVSKRNNYRVVLKPSVPGEPLVGRPSIGGWSVKFEDGYAMVDDKEWIKLMYAHPKFNQDFFVYEEDTADPFSSNRKSSEPEHDIVEMEYGHIGKNVNPRKTPLTKEDIEKKIAEQAKLMATEMVKSIVADLKESKEIKEEKGSKKTTTKNKTTKTKKEEQPEVSSEKVEEETIKETKLSE